MRKKKPRKKNGEMKGKNEKEVIMKREKEKKRRKRKSEKEEREGREKRG